VFFIDKDTADGTEGRNIFISSTEPDGRETVTSARSGRIEWLDDRQFLFGLDCLIKGIEDRIGQPWASAVRQTRKPPRPARRTLGPAPPGAHA